MQFAPKSKDELRPSIADGEYAATVMKAEDKTSKKSGSEMIALTLRVFADNAQVLVNDWLIPTTTSMWKVYDFCESAGILARYEAGDLQADDCMNADVFVKIKNEHSDEFGMQPRVKGYIKERTKPRYETAKEIIERQGVPASQGAAARQANAERSEEPGGDDVPF